MTNQDKGDNRREMLPAILEIIRSGSKFLVTGHERVDGDSTGCEVALHRGLGSMGKTVHVVNNEPILSRYNFLDIDGGICGVFDAGRMAGILQESDAVIVVDNNSWARLGALEEPIRNSGLPVICIDHHIVEELFSEFHLFDTSAAATGEIIYDLLVELGTDIDQQTAAALYTSICTDTGWFRFSNTTPRTFEICSNLLRLGVDPEEVSFSVNYQDSIESKKLVSRIVEGVRIECDGAYARAVATMEMAAEFGVSLVESDRAIEQIRSISGVQFAALFRDSEDGLVRVSLRSRDQYSAHAVAVALGGGGHRHASGVTLTGSLEEAVQQVSRAVAEQHQGFAEEGK